MAKVVSIERERTLRLADAIERELRMSGARELRVHEREVESSARWRRAAVMAAHRIGFKASTLNWGGTLVLIVHKPVPMAEQRRAAELMISILRGAGAFR